MIQPLKSTPARRLNSQFYHRSDNWPFDNREEMMKLWMSVVLWKYELNDNQLEEMRDTLQLFCSEGIKTYRASKPLQNKQN